MKRLRAPWWLIVAVIVIIRMQPIDLEEEDEKRPFSKKYRMQDIDSEEEEERHLLLVGAFMSQDFVAIESSSSDEEVEKKARSPRDKPRDRTRQTVASIFKEQGPYYVRRAYQMTEESFWEMHELLKAHMGSWRGPSLEEAEDATEWWEEWSDTNGDQVVGCNQVLCRWPTGRHCHLPWYWAFSGLHLCYWTVADAVNKCKCPELSIDFPTDHKEQKELALAFQAKRAVGIDCCAGAVDSIGECLLVRQ
jgi:hypothetical protein